MEVRVCSESLLSAVRQIRLPLIFHTTSSLEATWKSILHEIAPIQRSTPWGYWATSLLANGENRKSLCHYWGDRSMRSISRPSSPSSLPQAQWGSASFALQPSPERCAQASLGETDKWIETRNVLENTTLKRFILEWEDTQASHAESVKGPNTLANMPSPLPSSLDPIPVSRDERLSGPQRNQLLATPAGHTRRGRSVGAPA